MKLAKLVSKYGNVDWETIASIMKNRSARQCRDRWNYYLNPKIRSRPWTETEDKILLIKYFLIGPKWSVLCQYFENRTEIDIKNRYLSIQRRSKKFLSKIVDYPKGQKNTSDEDTLFEQIFSDSVDIEELLKF